MSFDRRQKIRETIADNEIEEVMVEQRNRAGRQTVYRVTMLEERQKMAQSQVNKVRLKIAVS
ncbi:hypothetical protein KC865_03590 [Candidatus Kaiserbacteria bacterium]|nr:hypothetical protein [Candidatus Kaiserbacteria bacterium]USN92470.1 MAG: hypothetical protein H6782_01490 [Candidatus Nomurabacteria bacterium]